VVVTAHPPPTDAVVAGLPAALPVGQGRPRILVVGDSVAFGIGYGLARWVTTTGSGTVLSYARNGCGLTTGTEVRRDAQIRATACQRWMDDLPAVLDMFRPDLVVAYTGGWDMVPRRLPDADGVRELGDPALDSWLGKQFERVFERLGARGAHIVWLNSLCVRKPAMGEFGPFDPRNIAALNRIIAAAARAEGERVTPVDLFSLVCPRGTFTSTLHGIENARPDGNHFSGPAAEWVATWLGPQLLREHRRATREEGEAVNGPP
jgi:hypothetical protein